MSRPPVSNTTPLPTSVTFGWPDLPQVRSMRRGARGGRAADGVDEREVLLEQVVADDRIDLGAVLAGELADRVFELGRAEVVRGRVDEVAPERDGRHGAFEFGPVDALGQREHDAVVLARLVAAESVGAESAKPSAASLRSPTAPSNL